MSTPKAFKKIYLETENRVFSEIMSNGKKYTIPRFQRDYAWTDNQWDELWEDITIMTTHKTQHFMGYLVFKVAYEKQYDVIDGQQRLTTILLILLAGLSRLQTLINQGNDPEDNQRRIKLYQESYLFIIDAVSLRPSAKLTLNRHNKAHFRDISKQLQVTQQRNITQTNRKINKAFQFFEKKFQAYSTGQEIATLIEDIANGLLFTTISVKDDLNAYTVFATLNARGLHLSTPDLLKNYLLSLIAHDDYYSENDFDEFEEQWADILQQLGETEFTNFLRSHTGMSEKIPNKFALYQALKQNINQPDKVLPYLASLKKYAAIYAALQNPDDVFWKECSGQYHAVNTALRVLQLFNIRTPLSVLMAAYTQLAAADFVTFVSRITALSVRYNIICSKPAKDQERVYNEIANKLMHEQATLYEITQALLTLYPNDEVFRLAFSEKSMPSRQSSKKIIYLLSAIENHVSNNTLDPTTLLTLEHVLPYHPSDQWQAYFGRDNYDNAIDRLGNMALLSKKSNLGQEPFSEKQQTLQASPYVINQHIANSSVWDIAAINRHQAWLAKQATAVWRIA